MNRTQTSPRRHPRETRAVRPTVLLLLLLLASAAQATDLAGPAEITAPGSYRLAGDIAGGGIAIRSSDVLLDGGGHRVLGSGVPGAIGVLAAGPVANVTVVNLTLLGWDVGVEYRDVAGGRIVDVNASNCTKNGLLIDRCSGVEVRNAVAARNGYPGIAVNGSTACRVASSTAVANGDVGIYLVGSGDCTVEACTAAENHLNGICLEGAETGAVVGCSLGRNGYPGVAVGGGRGVRISGNLLSRNGRAAVWLEGTGPCVVTRNTADESEVGLVVRNATVRPLAGGNVWLTPRQVEGRTISIPPFPLGRSRADALRVAPRAGLRLDEPR